MVWAPPMLLMGTDSMIPLPGISMNMITLVWVMSLRVLSRSATVAMTAFSVPVRPWVNRSLLVAVPRPSMVRATLRPRDL